MPYAFQGVCYATPSEVLTVFRKTFPLLGDVNWQWHVSSSVSDVGLVSYSVSTRSTISNTVAVRTGTMQLVQCSEVDAVPEFSAASASGIFVFFFSAVLALWFLSKNIGTILSAVRRF